MSAPVPLPIVVIGAGPAGLMAAEALADAGLPVEVFDAMPSAGRKFLLAGRGGLNITHSEPFDAFLSRYRERRPVMSPLLESFPPGALRDWVHRLGIDTFVGSSGRIFPEDMKAAPLLRAWLQRLRAAGVRFAMRHRWTGWADCPDGGVPTLAFSTPAGPRTVRCRAVVLALGGASWARLGSDGAWLGVLEQAGIPVAPLRPANCGFDLGCLPDRDTPGWSTHFAERFAGQPLKTVAARTDAGASADARADTGPDASVGADASADIGENEAGWRTGDFLITDTGIEGTLVYALSAELRDAIASQGSANLYVDLVPGRSLERLTGDLAKPRGGRSLVNHLRARAGFDPVRTGLLREVLGPGEFGVRAADAAAFAATIKALPLPLAAPRPIDEAISSAGGVRFEALDDALMLHGRPGVFCAGEMLDWEAPTGGYLLNACMATGLAAGRGAAAFVRAAG
ncbi:MAG: TIGR03862 family flavoprotein [Burkholderiaceae bacterium]